VAIPVIEVALPAAVVVSVVTVVAIAVTEVAILAHVVVQQGPGGPGRTVAKVPRPGGRRTLRYPPPSHPPQRTWE